MEAVERNKTGKSENYKRTLKRRSAAKFKIQGNISHHGNKNVTKAN